MITNNKMKDSNAKYEEWWEVTREYFVRELEKNLAQHRVDERMYMYKLEVYYKNFPDFVCGSPTNIETSGQDEKNEARPNGTTQEDELQTKEPQILKGEGQEEIEQQMDKKQEQMETTLITTTKQS